MLRFILGFILFIHGLIHLMGFAKAFKYAEISQLSLPIPRPAGTLWLLSAALFVFAAGLFLFKKESWWMVGLPAIALSQLLIFRYWQDAKFGTIANLMAGLLVLFSWATWSWNARMMRERQAFLTPVAQTAEKLTADMLAGLPPIVQKWIERSNSIGKPRVQAVHLHQTGRMRTTPTGKWMPVQAEQFFTVGKPGFFWTADVQAAPFIRLVGRDKYENSKGFMLIKALALVPVADAQGPATDQGAMLRYLAETIWFPSAALQPYIRWEAVDSLSAKATMRYGDVEASGIFTFTPDGDWHSFEALRYYDRKEGPSLEKWYIEADPGGFREFEDIRIPARSAVTWKLPSGDFNWYQLEITELKFNRPAP
ncbi:MAG: hypothetical protein IPM81_03085 [Saprospirales bacterium]|nr:hypothetical protein [Saprospirales bacterium]